MGKENIFEEAIQAILDCDDDRAFEIFDEAMAQKIDPVELLAKGYSAGMTEAGEQFVSGEIFLPELVFMTEIMKKVTEKVEATLDLGNTAKKGKMIIATVEGDVHDIGKGIVASLIKTNGIQVYDLGREVTVDTIIEKAEEYQVDIIGTSALLTTTMTEQRVLEEELRARGIRDKYKTIVGGAPVTQKWADRIGADAYCEDAMEAVKVVLELLEK